MAAGVTDHAWDTVYTAQMASFGLFIRIHINVRQTKKGAEK